MNWLTTLKGTVPPLVLAPAVFLIWLIALWMAKHFIFYRLKKWALDTKTPWGHILVDALSFPMDFVIVASGILLLTDLLSLSPKLDRTVTLVLQSCVIFTVAIFLDQLFCAFIDRYSHRNIFSHISHGLAKGLMRVFIIVIASLIFLDLLGISITPFLASLGIGSLAVALALQDSLSNLFAGVYMAVDRPVDVGHFVKLESGQEGFVVDIGWRSTRICTPANNTVVIPNSKLTGSVLVNYDLPNREIAVTVEVIVHQSSDLNRVEMVTLEVAREVLKNVTGAQAAFEPLVFFHTFADPGVQFTAVLRSSQFTDAPRIKHEFIKRLHERFRKEEIVIPYPTRTLITSPNK